ncbi:hypothetical protein ACIBSV_04825 [Embleya sp. NPDC050154]|uniref:hypothetical protein n=1 Tax=unclassified Embleya TaxID=2699296 RepID=UPI0037B3B86B
MAARTLPQSCVGVGCMLVREHLNTEQRFWAARFFPSGGVREDSGLLVALLMASALHRVARGLGMSDADPDAVMRVPVVPTHALLRTDHDAIEAARTFTNPAELDEFHTRLTRLCPGRDAVWPSVRWTAEDLLLVYAHAAATHRVLPTLDPTRALADIDPGLTVAGLWEE